MTSGRRAGEDHPALAWIRANPRLDSIQAGLSIQDIDFNDHQFMTWIDRRGTRDVNNHMWVEIKTFGAEPTFAQADTQLIVGQLLHTGGRYKRVKDIRGRARLVRSWGYHLWTMSGSSPEDSPQMWWDRRVIGVAELEDVLAFRRDPDTLHPRTERRHHTASVVPRLI